MNTPSIEAKKGHRAACGHLVARGRRVFLSPADGGSRCWGCQAAWAARKIRGGIAQAPNLTASTAATITWGPPLATSGYSVTLPPMPAEGSTWTATAAGGNVKWTLRDGNWTVPREPSRWERFVAYMMGTQA